MKVIRKSGFMLIREDRLLLCRKRGKMNRLILPGGKIEPGETPIECLHRELEEELGKVRAYGVWHVGQYVDQAAGDESRLIEIQLFGGELDGRPKARSEIAELVWFGREDDRAPLAQSLRNKIIPDLVARRLLRWPG